ncbi:hypothetical protein JCM10207_007055 [Rhodosporidiobolus poonsookiae]
MLRPLSPDSAPSATGRDCSTPPSRGRVVKALAVEAQAHGEGVKCTLYCKVALPTSSSSSPSSRPLSPQDPAFHLLNLPPLPHLTSHASFPLPLHPDDPEEAAHAAAALALPASSGAEGSIGRRRRSLSLAGLGAERRRCEVVEEGGEVAVVLLPAGKDTGDAGRPASRAGAVSPHLVGWGSGGARAGAAEFVVVLHVETTFRALKLPRFANTITLPTPFCLRNTLSFTLPPPSPSSPSPSWDLSVRPSLSNATFTALAPSSSSTGGTHVSGTFPSTSSLSLRWAPQLPPGDEAPLVVPEASFDVRWTIGEDGDARAAVEVSGTFEFAGLREKQWVELEVGAARDTLELVECEGDDGTPVLAWELADSALTPTPVPPATNALPTPPHLTELDDFTSALDDSLLDASLLSSTSAGPAFPVTPTPVSRRRPSSRASGPRPPSFTSLFDTAPPAALVVDTASALGEVSLLEVQLPPEHEEERDEFGGDRRGRDKGSEGSLLGQEAPFDPEASAMDMSFEIADAEEDEDEEDPPTPSSPVRPSTKIRVQIDLGPALRRLASRPVEDTLDARPSFAFTVHLAFAASSLSPSRSSPHRVSLPTFALPSATSEETLVTVSALTNSPSPSAPQRRVELLPDSLPPYRPGSDHPPPSPLPGTGGRARWATVRGAGEGRARKISGPVEVEIVSAPAEEGVFAAAQARAPGELHRHVEAEDEQPSPSPTSSPADELALPRPPTSASASAATTDSFLSSSPSPPPAAPLSIASVRVQITPIPPASPAQPWRLFHRVVFAHPYRRGFTVPVAHGATVRAEDAWDGTGGTVALQQETARGADGAETVRIAPARRSAGVVEVVYVEERLAAGEKVEVGRVLPTFEDKVAKVEVKVLVPEGYELDTSKHGFDLASSTGSTSTFTRFLVPANACSDLGISMARNTPASEPPAALLGTSKQPSSLNARRHGQTRSNYALIALSALISFYFSYHYFSAPAVAPFTCPRVLSAVTLTHTHFSTSTATIVSTATHLATPTSIVTSTTTATRTSTVTSYLPASPSATLASASSSSSSFSPSSFSSATVSPSPSLAPALSSSLTFTDDFPPPSPPRAPARATPAYRAALALEDSARSAVEAFRTIRVGSLFPAWAFENLMDVAFSKIGAKEGFVFILGVTSDSQYRYDCKPKRWKRGDPCCDFCVCAELTDDKPHYVVTRVGTTHNHSFHPTPAERAVAVKEANGIIADAKRDTLELVEALLNKLRRPSRPEKSDKALPTGGQVEVMKDLLPAFSEEEIRAFEQKMRAKGALLVSYPTQGIFPPKRRRSSTPAGSSSAKAPSHPASIAVNKKVTHRAVENGSFARNTTHGGPASSVFPPYKPVSRAAHSSDFFPHDSSSAAAAPPVASGSGPTFGGKASWPSLKQFEHDVHLTSQEEGWQGLSGPGTEPHPTAWFCQARGCSFRVAVVEAKGGKGWRLNAETSRLQHEHGDDFGGGFDGDEVFNGGEEEVVEQAGEAQPTPLKPVKKAVSKKRPADATPDATPDSKKRKKELKTKQRAAAREESPDLTIVEIGDKVPVADAEPNTPRSESTQRDKSSTPAAYRSTSKAPSNPGRASSSQPSLSASLRASSLPISPGFFDYLRQLDDACGDDFANVLGPVLVFKGVNTVAKLKRFMRKGVDGVNKVLELVRGEEGEAEAVIEVFGECLLERAGDEKVNEEVKAE